LEPRQYFPGGKLEKFTGGDREFLYHRVPGQRALSARTPGQSRQGINLFLNLPVIGS
jgi:hypothetical protein